MPTFHKGLVDYSKLDDPNALLVCTTNSTVKANGGVVMGRGAALAVMRQHPWVPYTAGLAILQSMGRKYGFMVVTKGSERIGLFQVKYHWRDDARPGLIEMSVQRMLEYDHVHGLPKEVHMNYPGVGNGRLNEASVEHLLADLPANVHIWR